MDPLGLGKPAPVDPLTLAQQLMAQYEATADDSKGAIDPLALANELLAQSEAPKVDPLALANELLAQSGPARRPVDPLALANELLAQSGIATPPPPASLAPIVDRPQLDPLGLSSLGPPEAPAPQRLELERGAGSETSFAPKPSLSKPETKLELQQAPETRRMEPTSLADRAKLQQAPETRRMEPTSLSERAQQLQQAPETRRMEPTSLSERAQRPPVPPQFEPAPPPWVQQPEAPPPPRSQQFEPAPPPWVQPPAAPPQPRSQQFEPAPPPWVQQPEAPPQPSSQQFEPPPPPRPAQPEAPPAPPPPPQTWSAPRQAPLVRPADPPSVVGPPSGRLNRREERQLTYVQTQILRLRAMFDSRVRVTPDDVVIFTRQFCAMVTSGLQMHQSLYFYAEGDPERGLSVVIHDVADRLGEGNSLSNCLKRYPGIFSDVYVGLIAAGEATGMLSGMLTKLADLYEKNQRIRKKVWATLTYPMVLMIISFLCVAAFLYYVMPQMVPLFTTLGVQLPLPTRMLLQISAFLKNPLTLLGAMATPIMLFLLWPIIVQILRSDPDRMRTLHRIPLEIPVLGRMVEKIITGRIMFSMAVGSSRVDLQACKLEYSIVSPK